MADDDDERMPDEEWNFRARHETKTQRLDRNWAALLQELRVVQTGVQLLTGFVVSPRVGLVAAVVAAALFCGLCLLATILRLRHHHDDPD